LGDVYADLEEFVAAQDSYRQADEFVQPENDRFFSHYLKLSEARVARSQGQYAQAHRLIGTVQLEKEASGYEQGLFHLEKGRLAVIEKNTSQALSNLQEAKRYFQRDGRTLEYAWSQLWLSSAAYQRGDIETARVAIQEILTLTRTKNIMHMMVPQVRQVKESLLGMQKDLNLRNDLEKFLNEISLHENRLPSTRRKLRSFAKFVTLAEPHLSIRGLGRAQVKVDGKTLSPSDWKTQSVRDLFFYFLNTSQAVSKEQVGLAFWPEIDPRKLKMRFKNDIYRLRRAIGSKAILFDGDLYTFNRALDYDYDVEIFENYLAHAQKTSDEKEKMTSYRAAIDLVRGTYLSDISATWVWPERERLNRLYVAALQDLSNLYFTQNRLEDAQEMCQRALRHDPCMEEAHRLLMKIYFSLEDRSAIVRQYQLCKEILQEELDISPSDETEKLYLQLLL
jgi:two-component SAPR family response regulator